MEWALVSRGIVGVQFVSGAAWGSLANVHRLSLSDVTRYFHILQIFIFTYYRLLLRSSFAASQQFGVT